MNRGAEPNWEYATGRGGRHYHGWKVVAALFIVGMMVYGCGLYSFTLFITPLTDEFGWNRATTSALVSVYWLAAPLTLVGEPLMRRLGGFRLIAAGVIIAAAATFCLGLCSTLPLLFVLRVLMGIGKVLMASGISLLAAYWFKARFGLALACCYAGWHFGGLVMVPLTQLLIDMVGWRETTALLAFAIVAIGLPPLLLWVRVPSPFDRGVEPETELPLTQIEDTPLAQPRANFASVLGHPMLWLSIGVTVLAGFAYGAVLTNEAVLIDEIPMLRGLGAAAVSATALAALCGAIAMGWLADRLPFLKLALLELGLMLAGIVGFLCLYAVPQPALMFAAALCFGIAVGGFEAAVLPNLRRSLRTAAFGHAFGIWYLCYLATLFIAPIGAGWIRDIALDYAPALVILAVMTAASVVPALEIARRSRLDSRR